MKSFFKILLTFSFILIISASNDFRDKDSFIFSQFQSFIKKHKKSYSTVDEYIARYETFKSNYDKMTSFSVRPNQKYRVGVSKFMDLTPQEFKNTYLNLKITLLDQLKAKSGKFSVSKLLETPKTLDWREKGAVGAIKDQGQCGSCWAFSTVANLEGIYYLKNQKSITLSEQNLVDCDKADNGCNGGLMENSLEFVKENGIGLSEEYPYHARDESCKKGIKSAMKINGFSFAPSDNEEDIKSMLAQNGPLSIAVNAEPFQFYSGGILDSDSSECDPNSLNHGVAIVGYGEENGTEYWVIRNSWGKSWGENGYIRVALGKGVCGVNRYVITGDL